MKKVYLFTESPSMDDPWHIVFTNKQEAVSYLKHQIEVTFSCPFEQAKEYCTDFAVVDGNLYIESQECTWSLEQEIEKHLPKAVYEDLDIGRFQLVFNGVTYDKGYPLGILLIFEFESADANAKPLHNGNPVRTLHVEMGTPELVSKFTEDGVRHLTDATEDHEQVDLYMYNTEALMDLSGECWPL